MDNPAYPVIQTQPGVVVNVVSQQPQPPRDWGSGICGCFDDMGICMCGTFCSLCLWRKIAVTQNENCCTACCVPGGTIALRTNVRLRHNIKGDICNDCCMFYWCGSCTTCQLAREMKTLGYDIP